MKNKISVVLLILIVMVLAFSACAPNRQYKGFGFMGTFYSIKAKGGYDQKQTENLLAELEDAFSVDREIAKINNAKKGEVVQLSDYAFDLISFAFDFHDLELTKNALDVSIYPVVKLWGFDNTFPDPDKMTPPDDDAIAEALANVGLDKFILDRTNKTIVKSIDEARLDLGALGKGYAASELMNKGGFQEGLINIGGTIAAKGGEYKVGIEPPIPSNNSYIAWFYLTDGQVCSTSGSYQRYYTFEDVIYHHIFGLDGRPVTTDIVSATVIANDGKLADALSTTCFILGESQSKELLEYFNASAIFVYKDKTVSSYNIDATITDEGYKTK